MDEKQFIEVSLGVTETDEVTINRKFVIYFVKNCYTRLFIFYLQKLSTPWIAILTSVPVWALLITQSVQNWGFWMLLTKMPSYMNSALGYDIQQASSNINAKSQISFLIACIKLKNY